MQAKIVEITRDENGNLKEIYRPDEKTELRYPVQSGDGTREDNMEATILLECCYAFEYPERLDFYIK